MIPTRMTIEFENGQTVVAEGQAIREFSLDRRLETEPIPGLPPQVRIAIKARCRYHVASSEQKAVAS